MEIKSPDVNVVKKIVEDRIRCYLSVLLGSFERAEYYMGYTNKENTKKSFSWLNVVIEHYKELKLQAGWKNDQFLGLAVLVKSWLENSYTKEEELFALKALRELLKITNLNDELNTPDAYALEAELDSIIEQ